MWKSLGCSNHTKKSTIVSKNLRCWDVSFNNWNHQIGLPFTMPIFLVLGREPHPTGLDTLCRWNGPDNSGLKDQYAEACQNCSWSQTMETLSAVVYTLLKKGFGFWWDEMCFLHAKTKTDNLFLKPKFSQGFIHTTTTSLGILLSKIHACQKCTHYSCTFSSRNWEKGGQSS